MTKLRTCQTHLFITRDSSVDVLDFLTANDTEFTLELGGDHFV